MKPTIYYRFDTPSGAPRDTPQSSAGKQHEQITRSHHANLDGLRQKVSKELIAEKQKLLPAGFKLEADGKIVGQRTGKVYAKMDINSLWIGRDLNQDLVIRDKNQSYTYSSYSNTLDKTPISDIVSGLPELEHVNGRGVGISRVDSEFFSISGDIATVTTYTGQSAKIKLPTKDTKTLRVVSISGDYYLYNSSGEIFAYTRKGEIKKINIPTKLYGFQEYTWDGHAVYILGQDHQLYDPLTGKKEPSPGPNEPYLTGTTTINYSKIKEKN